MNPIDVKLKAFEQADEIRNFPLGKFELIRIGGVTVGRATYQPGWRWSTHVGPLTGSRNCQVEHVGVVISGRATAAMEDGNVVELGPGVAFHIPPGHDSWVIGSEPYVSLHVLGAGDYARGAVIDPGEGDGSATSAG